MIDSILNNFHRYKRRPLYVDLDHIPEDEELIARLIARGDYVAKTHFPQAGNSPECERLLRKLIPCSKIISPLRDELAQQVEHFNDLWEPYGKLHVPFR